MTIARRRPWPVLIVLLAVLLLGGLVLFPRSQPAAEQRNVGFLDTNRVHTYSTIAELSRDSVAVVEFTATSDIQMDYVGPHQVPFSIVTVSGARVLWGAVAPAALRVRQLGGPRGNTDFHADVPLTSPGSRYVAFLQRFTYGPGHDTDQYVITGGGAGLYRFVDGDTVAREDPDSTSLPNTLTLADLVSQASASS